MDIFAGLIELGTIKLQSFFRAGDVAHAEEDYGITSDL
jgi:hypothetical protein